VPSRGRRQRRILIESSPPSLTPTELRSQDFIVFEFLVSFKRYRVGSGGPESPSYSLSEARIGSAAEERDGRPAVAGDDGAVGSEALAEWRELLGERRSFESPRQSVALAYAEVVDGPHVQPAQLEHQIHLGGPAADP